MRVPAERICLTAFLALAVVMTWPLGRVWRPELPDLNDAQFNVWRLSWIARQLRLDPSHVFDANIFFPTPNTLAYSDAIMLPGVAAAPAIWVGLHPFVVHNLVVVAAFWLAAYCGYRLCLRITNAFWPAFFGGVVCGFAPYRFGHIAHLELLWTAFLPLTVLALLELADRPVVASGLKLALCQVLQTLCSVYYGIFLAIYVALATPLVIAGRGWRTTLKFGSSVAIAGLVASVVLLPYIAKYRDASRELAARSIHEMAMFSAVPADYLRVSRDNKLPLHEGSTGEEERSLYPGAVAVILSLVALATTPRRALPYTALLVASIDLSFGMNGLLYPLALKLLPFLSGLRAPARFGAFVVLSLSVLAAMGLAHLLSRQPRSRWLGMAVVTAALVEYWASPLVTRERPLEAPPVYAWLAQQPRGVVLELPTPSPASMWAHETDYQLMSIYHWQPLVNGYSGHAPDSYMRLLQSLRSFPSPSSIEQVRQHQVRWILIHEGLFDRQTLAQLMERVLNSPAFRILGTFDDGMGHATIVELL